MIIAWARGKFTSKTASFPLGGDIDISVAARMVRLSYEKAAQCTRTWYKLLDAGAQPIIHFEPNATYFKNYWVVFLQLSLTFKIYFTSFGLLLIPSSCRSEIYKFWNFRSFTTNMYSLYIGYICFECKNSYITLNVHWWVKNNVDLKVVGIHGIRYIVSSLWVFLVREVEH